MAGKKEKKPKEAEAEAAAPAAEGEDGAPAKKKLAGKTLILFIVLPAVLILGGGAATAMMLLGGKKEAAAEEPADHSGIPEEGAEGEGHAKKDDHGKEKKDDHAKKKDDGHGGGGEASGDHAATMDLGSLMPGEDGAPSYYDMPGLIVNLSGKDNGRPLVLKLDLVLEAGEAGAFERVPALMPRLQDQIQTFLRELRVEDLDGSAGTYRLRLELLKRFNLVLAPQKIDAVLIEGILVQ